MKKTLRSRIRVSAARVAAVPLNNAGRNAAVSRMQRKSRGLERMASRRRRMFLKRQTLNPMRKTPKRRNPSGRHVPIIQRQLPLTKPVAVVGIGIAAHEGALSRWINQLLGVLMILSLLLWSISGVILWWRRREQGAQGGTWVPKPAMSRGLTSIILSTVICLPLFAASLIVVLLCEWLVLSRILPVRP